MPLLEDHLPQEEGLLQAGADLAAGVDSTVAGPGRMIGVAVAMTTGAEEMEGVATVVAAMVAAVEVRSFVAILKASPCLI